MKNMTGCFWKTWTKEMTGNENWLVSFFSLNIKVNLNSLFFCSQRLLMWPVVKERVVIYPTILKHNFPLFRLTRSLSQRRFEINTKSSEQNSHSRGASSDIWDLKLTIKKLTWNFLVKRWRFRPTTCRNDGFLFWTARVNTLETFYKISFTRPTSPLSSRTLIPCGWLGLLVKIFSTTPFVNRPIRWSCFKTIFTSCPILIFARSVPLISI